MHIWHSVTEGDHTRLLWTVTIVAHFYGPSNQIYLYLSGASLATLLSLLAVEYSSQFKGMSELPRKTCVRAQHRSSATNMTTRSKELLAEDPPNVLRLLQLKPSLTEKLDTLKRLDNEILHMVQVAVRDN